MPGRSFSSPNYRYGFNGKEKDDDVSGSGNNLDFGARVYNTRLARWLSLDPEASKYVSLSPYQFASNCPVALYDLDGRRFFFAAGSGDDKLAPSHYSEKFADALASAGISGFVRVHAHASDGSSENTPGAVSGTINDADFSLNSPFATLPYNKVTQSDYPEQSTRVKLPTDRRIFSAAVTIIRELFKTPLKEGEQLNLGGYSYGSTLMAQVALYLLKEAHVRRIDNLVLIGTPVSESSDLYKELLNYQKEGKIGNIISISEPDDHVVGSSGKNSEERKRIWSETKWQGILHINNGHIRFTYANDEGERTRKKFSKELKKIGVN